MCRTVDLSQHLPLRTSLMTSNSSGARVSARCPEERERSFAPISQSLFKFVMMQPRSVEAVAVNGNDRSSHLAHEQMRSAETVTLVSFSTSPLDNTPLQQIVWLELEIFSERTVRGILDHRARI